MAPKIAALNVIKVATTPIEHMTNDWKLNWESGSKFETTYEDWQSFSLLSVRDWRDSWRQMPTTSDLSKKETEPSTFLLSFTGNKECL